MDERTRQDSERNRRALLAEHEKEKAWGELIEDWKNRKSKGVLGDLSSSMRH